jgi:ParB-like chromosome segregation protein Spo0J
MGIYCLILDGVTRRHFLWLPARVRVSLVTTTRHQEPMIAVDDLDERFSAFRLREPKTVEAMACSLGRYGQLSPLVVFDDGHGIQVIDGFKRLHAARRLHWPKLEVRHCDVDVAEAKVQLAILHRGHGLTELEEGWLIRSLYREDRLSQSAIAERLGRHRSWICRRLLLVEGLVDEVQAHVRMGLIAPRAAVTLAVLPRGNQIAAMTAVIQRGLTVRQTELLVAQALAADDAGAQSTLLGRWSSGAVTLPQPGPRSTRAIRSEADCVAADITTLHRVAARLDARLLATPLCAFGSAAAELIAGNLEALIPTLVALERTIVRTTTPKGAKAHKEQSAA